jgi:superfamily I DNA/RNA helicase
MLRERSLLYVAATRARDELALSWSGERSQLLSAPM